MSAERHVISVLGVRVEVEGPHHRIITEPTRPVESPPPTAGVDPPPAEETDEEPSLT
jgi:hypothetical protein